jgi:orotidine-5'-phosphate decarboxylase
MSDYKELVETLREVAKLVRFRAALAPEIVASFKAEADLMEKAADKIDRLQKEVQDFELDSITTNLELRDALEEVEKLEKEVQKLSLDMIVAHGQAFDALEEVKKLKSAKNLCVFIATDYIELSFEKAQWQRDDWHKRCKKLIESLYADEEGD